MCVRATEPIMHELPAVWKPWLEAGSRVPPVACVLAVGVPKKMNQALIKKAKAVGSDLGFLS